MASALLDKFSSVGTFTITLASLASSTAGVGRQATVIDNTTNRYKSAQIAVSITVGTTPTANTAIYIYAIRSDKNTTAIRTDGAGASDAAWTQKNARLIGILQVPANTSNVAYSDVFDWPFDSLGPEWSVGVVNSSGVALNSTGSNHSITWIGTVIEAQ